MNKSQSSGKTARSSYKVDDAAEFIERLSMGAYGRFLIGIIDDADALSEVIQNKLLKTLEEPAANTILILAASNRDNLLSTVRSRCSDIRLDEYMGPADPEEEDLEEAGASAEALQQLVSMMLDPKSRFHEFRTALDKHIKSKEDALLLLDLLEDDLRGRMTGLSNSSASIDELKNIAALIELSAVTRMDIRREMAHGKALRRLFLEMR